MVFFPPNRESQHASKSNHPSHHSSLITSHPIHIHSSHHHNTILLQYFHFDSIIMSGDNPQPEPTTDNDAARRHIVQVKSEYVLSERPPCLAPPQETPPVAAAAGEAIPNSTSTTDLGNGNTNGRNNKNKTRGQNTKRPRDSKIDFGDKACLAVVRGEVCPFLQTAKGCRYNHDLKELLANRPADLNEGEGGAEWLKNECPFWKSRG